MEGLPAEGARVLVDSVVASARGHELLGKDPRIPSREHAVFIVCVALWSLREMNAVEFILSRRVQWLPFSSLMVALRKTLVSEVSIERELLNQMRMILSGRRHRPDHAVTVRDLVREWVIDSAALSTRFNPYEQVLRVAAGAVKAAAADAEALDAAAQRLAGRWQVFLRHEPDLADRLRRTVDGALRSAVEPDND